MSNSIVYHVVHFAYKSSVTHAEKRQVAERFMALKNECKGEGHQPYILDIKGGKNTSPEQKDNGFEVCMWTVSFCQQKSAPLPIIISLCILAVVVVAYFHNALCERKRSRLLCSQREGTSRLSSICQINWDRQSCCSWFQWWNILNQQEQNIHDGCGYCMHYVATMYVPALQRGFWKVWMGHYNQDVFRRQSYNDICVST